MAAFISPLCCFMKETIACRSVCLVCQCHCYSICVCVDIVFSPRLPRLSVLCGLVCSSTAEATQSRKQLSHAHLHLTLTRLHTHHKLTMIWHNLITTSTQTLNSPSQLHHNLRIRCCDLYCLQPTNPNPTTIITIITITHSLQQQGAFMTALPASVPPLSLSFSFTLTRSLPPLLCLLSLVTRALYVPLPPCLFLCFYPCIVVGRLLACLLFFLF